MSIRTPAQATPSPGSTERLHALDAVRGGALLLGILFHATMSFIDSDEPMWLVVDQQPSTVLTLTFYVLHIFRMATFFLIAGFFAHLLLRRRGARGFVRDRLRRIGVPLLAGWPPLFAALAGGAIWGAVVMHGGDLPAAPPTDPDPPPLAFPLTHLWFLYVLLWLYAAALAVDAGLQRWPAWPRLQARVDAAVALLVAAPWGIGLLALPAWLGLLALPEWRPWLGVPTPDASLLPNVAAVAAFGSTFAFGWLLHRQPHLLAVLEQRAVAYLAGAVALTAGCVWHLGIRGDVAIAALDGPTAIYAAAYALALWTWTFAFIGLALRHLAGYSARRRYIADASYWMYLVHLPLVLALQILLSQLAWPWPIKLVVILGVATPLMLWSYRVWVRGTAIGAVLNGRRLPPFGAPEHVAQVPVIPATMAADRHRAGTPGVTP